MEPTTQQQAARQQNAAVHPIFQGFCRALSGDALRAANEPRQHLRPFIVKVGQRLEFAAMGTDSCAVTMQHIELCEVGEKLSVTALRSKA